MYWRIKIRNDRGSEFAVIESVGEWSDGDRNCVGSIKLVERNRGLEEKLKVYGSIHVPIIMCRNMFIYEGMRHVCFPDSMLAMIGFPISERFFQIPECSHHRVEDFLPEFKIIRVRLGLFWSWMDSLIPIISAISEVEAAGKGDPVWFADFAKRFNIILFANCV